MSRSFKITSTGFDHHVSYKSVREAQNKGLILTLNGIEDCVIEVAPKEINVRRVLIQSAFVWARSHNCNLAD